MKGYGAALIALGVLVVIIALNLDITVRTEVSASSILSGVSVPSEVSNIGLLQRQMIWLQIGFSSCIIGAVFVAAGAVADAIGSNGRHALSEPEPATAAAGATTTADAAEGGTAPTYSPEAAAAADEKTMWLGAVIAALIIFAIIALAMNQTRTMTSAPVSNMAASDETLMGNDVTSVGVDTALNDVAPTPATTEHKSASPATAPLDDDADVDQNGEVGRDSFQGE